MSRLRGALLRLSTTNRRFLRCVTDAREQSAVTVSTVKTDGKTRTFAIAAKK
jgi:hypothetical protein